MNGDHLKPHSPFIPLCSSLVPRPRSVSTRGPEGAGASLTRPARPYIGGVPPIPQLDSRPVPRGATIKACPPPFTQRALRVLLGRKVPRPSRVPVRCPGREERSSASPAPVYEGSVLGGPLGWKLSLHLSSVPLCPLQPAVTLPSPTHILSCRVCVPPPVSARCSPEGAGRAELCPARPYTGGCHLYPS